MQKGGAYNRASTVHVVTYIYYSYTRTYDISILHQIELPTLVL